MLVDFVVSAVVEAGLGLVVVIQACPQKAEKTIHRVPVAILKFISLFTKLAGLEWQIL